MSPAHDPLDESGDAMPANPVRRRIALLAGLLFLVLILGALLWFVASNTETREGGPGMFSGTAGTASAPA